MGKQRNDAVASDLDVGAAEPTPTVTGVNGKQRKPMQGDEVRPQCERCSTADHPVLMAALSTREYYTYYQCPLCQNRTKRPRYEVLRQFNRRPPEQNYSAR